MQKIQNPKESNIKSIAMYDEMSSSYLSYAMSVIVSRALPDVRDGLKPVHRRILYAMYKGGFDWTKQFRKSARIVGDVIGKYHPHGDQAVYDALVRMVQEFSMSLPLIDGQGNFGSIDGDPPAAMRYTETKLSKISQYLIEDIEKNTVNFKSNYDETENEPVVLPAQYPNLLVNGAGGIAVGMATSIPPHNLGEIINGTLALIENKDIKLNELMKHIPGPDFPTGGTIIGKNIIKEGYKVGRGSFKIRGNINIEQRKNGKERIVITSIPYQVNKSTLNERIVELVRDKKIEGISDIRDESNRGELSFLNFEFLIFILPFQVKARPVLPDLVGKTQSNISIPLITAPKMSEGVPTPIKYLGLFLGICFLTASRTLNISF